MKDKLKTLWKRMSDAIPDKKNSAKYIKERKEEHQNEKDKCAEGKFKFFGFSFSMPPHMNNKDHFFVYLSWYENSGSKNIKYDCGAYMLLKDFVEILQKPGV